VFIEGKVKPSQVASWSIQGAWDAFLWRQDGRLDSSNLFTQLYHKVRFIHGLRTLGTDGLVQGIAFPACSTRTMRKLGSNPVIRKAAAMIGEYATDAIYVALVPDTAEDLNDFFTRTLPQGPQDDITGWSTAGWGYLSWAQVEAFCEAHGLIHTPRVFRFNDGQMY
jgi:hypothetical protein